MAVLKVVVSAVAVALAAAESAVDLGTATNFAVLTKAGITSVAPCIITGDIGVSPIAATAMTGFALVADSSNVFSTSVQVTGKIYAADYFPPSPATMSTAISDMETAYTDAASRATSSAANLNVLAGLIGGHTFTEGVYTFGSAVSFDADIYLNGTATSVFIFQTTNGVLVGPATSVILVDDGTGGGIPQASNIFWQMASDLEVGTTSHMEGTFLVKTAVKFKTGSSLNGRILSQTAAALDQTTVTQPRADCADSSDWYVRGNTTETCAWVAEDPEARCSKTNDLEVYAFEKCSVTCGACDVLCKDDASWHKKNDVNKTCAWVKRFADRFDAVGEDDTLASESCLSATNNCEPGLYAETCEDSSSWHKKGNAEKTCDWVAQGQASRRCKTKGEDNVWAFEQCQVTCGNCDAPCTDSPTWYRKNQPEKTCDWVSRSSMRFGKVGDDGMYAWESCRLATKSCNF